MFPTASESVPSELSSTVTTRSWPARSGPMIGCSGVATAAVVESRRMLARTLEHYDRHGFGVWLAEDLSSGEPLGRAGLSYHRAWTEGDPEVGWWIAPEHWGKGLATEAGAAAIEYAFGTLGVGRVVSICIEANVPSRRVMEKLELRKLAEVPFPELDLVLWVHARQRVAASA